MSVCFVVPAHGRLELAAICLSQLRRTCDALGDATAVVVADDANLDVAAALGFHVVEHPNQPLGAKLNAGYVCAADLGAEFFVPFGTDDFVDHRLIRAQTLADGEVRCSRVSAVVREDGRALAVLRIPYDGGDGVRVIPRATLEPLGFRPVDDDRDRAMDASTMRRLSTHLERRPKVTYLDVHGLQIVDFKSAGEQLNVYAACLQYLARDEMDPWAPLAEVYPRDAVDDVRSLYGRRGALPPRAPHRDGPVVAFPLTKDPAAFPAAMDRMRVDPTLEWV